MIFLIGNKKKCNHKKHCVVESIRALLMLSHASFFELSTHEKFTMEFFNILFKYCHFALETY